MAPSLAVRFALAYLYTFGSGDRAAYDAFWSALRQPGEEYGNHVQRCSMACAALEAIYRDLGLSRTPRMIFYGAKKA